VKHVARRIRHFHRNQTISDFRYRDVLWEKLFLDALRNTSFDGVTVSCAPAVQFRATAAPAHLPPPPPSLDRCCARYIVFRKITPPVSPLPPPRRLLPCENIGSCEQRDESAESENRQSNRRILIEIMIVALLGPLPISCQRPPSSSRKSASS